MKRFSEWGARLFLASLVLGLLVVLVAARWLDRRGVIEVHATVPEAGGWSPENLAAKVGEPLSLRLVSDDVVHGFAIGQSDQPVIELYPGQPVETTLLFDKPGKYVYYCTRWCGLNHWRMRGVIEVTGSAEKVATQAAPPLYVEMGLDLDAEHSADQIPVRRLSAANGAALEVELPAIYRSRAYYQAHSPAQAWQDLRTEPALSGLDAGQLWDLVAYIWSQQASPEGLAEGQRLYAANCAACHGEQGEGDGVMAAFLTETAQDEEGHTQINDHPGEISGHDTTAPADFTDLAHMLGASPAVLHGKIVRGGMGTGMPYWGPIFTDAQLWNIVSFLWTFQFQYPEVK